MESVVYKTVDGGAIALDVYPAREPGAPVLLWLHGGALIMGGRADVPELLREELTRAGFAVVSADYRLAPETKLPEILTDVTDAAAWVQGAGAERFGFDGERLAVAGASAGGYLTLSLGVLLGRRARALVSFFGYGDVIGDWYLRPDPFYRAQGLIPADVAEAAVGAESAVDTDEAAGTGPVADVSEAVGGGAAGARGAVADVREAVGGGAAGAGGAVADVREAVGGGVDRHQFYLYCRQHGLWPERVTGMDPRDGLEPFYPYCPERNVTGDFPPTLLLHGDADTDVPYELSVSMAAALTAADIEHQLITIPNGPHGYVRGVTREDYESPSPSAEAISLRRALEFLKRNLSAGG